MKRRTLHPEVKMTAKERLAIYGKLIMVARPIWKWLGVSCLLCTLLILCSVLAPKLTGQVTNEIYAYWETSLAGTAAGGLAETVLSALGDT